MWSLSLVIFDTEFTEECQAFIPIHHWPGCRWPASWGWPWVLLTQRYSSAQRADPPGGAGGRRAATATRAEGELATEKREYHVISVWKWEIPKEKTGVVGNWWRRRENIMLFLFGSEKYQRKRQGSWGNNEAGYCSRLDTHSQVFLPIYTSVVQQRWNQVRLWCSKDETKS